MAGTAMAVPVKVPVRYRPNAASSGWSDGHKLVTTDMKPMKVSIVDT